MIDTANDTVNLDEPEFVGMKLHADREQRKEFFTALAKAQSMFEPIHKTRTVHVEGRNGKSGYSFNYAPLDEVLEKTKQGLSANGLALFHTLGSDGKGPVLTAMLTHSSGACITSHLRLSTTTVDYEGNERPKTSQEMASDVTYRRRYMITCLLGVSAEEDDDGASGEQMSRTVQDRGPRAGTQAKPPVPQQKPAPKKEEKPEPSKVVPIQPPPLPTAAQSDVVPAKASKETMDRMLGLMKELGFTKGKMTHDWFMELLNIPPSMDLSEEQAQKLIANLEQRKAS